MKCIICKEERSDPSEEHIVPKGIGGSLVTYRVCKECNDKLAHKADSELVNDWFMESKKFVHEIKGRKNQVKDPLGVGTLKSDPYRNVMFGRDANGKPSVKIAPKIEIGNNKIMISVDPKEKFEDIKNMVNKRLKRLGGYPLTEEQIKNLKLNLEGRSTNNGSLEIIVQKNILKNPPYKGFVKIAYELGFYFLGDDYLNDVTGKTLLNFILDTNPVEESLLKY
ncbi:MAG: HNH endonuclease, partial [Methanobacterium paludis]|nr:HNH endonuclease [Methanobacterium paludis]